MLRTISALLGLTLLLGCEVISSNNNDNTPDGSTLQLVTDAPHYTPDTVATITITNTSAATIYYNSCMPTSLEALDGNNLAGTLYFAVCECLCITELAPEESWSMDVQLIEDDHQQDFPGLREDLNYRFRLEFFEDDQLQTLLPDAVLVTNTFEIRP